MAAPAGSRARTAARTAVAVAPRPVSHEVLARALGEAPFAVAHVEAPSVMVEGRFHPAACRWLVRKHNIRPVLGTTMAHARRLADWIEFLRVERHRVGPTVAQSDVFVAIEDDLAAYYRRRQYDDERKVSSTSWHGDRSTIKQFHEFLQRTYGVPAPFEVDRVTLPGGQVVESIVGYTPRRRAGSRGTPITPGYAELLVQAALRIDRDGRQDAVTTVDRDAAFVSLGLATGMRRKTLAYITRYEIPPRTREPLSMIRVPDFITKGDAGGDAFVFAHHLDTVHNYLEGHRAELVRSGRPYRPADPIVIEEANPHTWSTTIAGRRVTRNWVETTSETRLRLVDTDGATPLVWLDPVTAGPVGYDTCGRITALAARWARQHLNPDFPARFRTHDLRHTYAVHLTVCIFKRALRDLVDPAVAVAYAPQRLADAVELTRQSLGHASEDSTALYTKHAFKFLDIDLDDFLGRR